MKFLFRVVKNQREKFSIKLETFFSFFSINFRETEVELLKYAYYPLPR